MKKPRCLHTMQKGAICWRVDEHKGPHRSRSYVDRVTIRSGNYERTQAEMIPAHHRDKSFNGALDRYAALGLAKPGDKLYEKIRERLCSGLYSRPR